MELSGYLRRAEKLLSADERDEVVRMVALDPTVGVVMQGSGGFRKLRVGLEGRGKSSGARVIYFFHDERLPVYLFSVYAKNEKSSLSKQELNRLRVLAQATVKEALGERV